MSDGTVSSERPKTQGKHQREKRKQDWTAFDLELISCAKNHWVVDLYFMGDIPLDDSGDTHSTIKGTILVVDYYFIKVAIPTDQGSQREVWVAKSAIAAAVSHKLKVN